MEKAMTETKIYRKATVSRATATAQLFKHLPDADLASFERKVATAAEAAKTPGAKAGDEIYVATVRVAEFPPKKDEGESEDSAPEEKEAPAPPKDGGDSEGGDDSGPADDDGDSDDGGDVPDFGSDADGPGAPGEPHGHKMNPQEETNHLLTQILHALQGGAGPHGAGPDPLGGPDLPDIGAPGQGDAMAPPPGGPGGHAPLPPPIKPKSPAMPGGAFSHVIAGKDEFTFIRTDVKADGLGHRALISEAREMAPGYRVAKLTVDPDQDTAEFRMVRV